MADEVARLVAVMEANFKSFEKDQLKLVRNNDRMFATMEKRLAQTERRFSKGFSGVTLGKSLLAGGAVIGGLGALAKKAIEAAAAIGDTAVQSGVAVERLQSLRFAATQAGASTDLLDTAMTTLNKSLGDFVNTGGGKAAASFKALGIDKMIGAGQVRNAEEAFDTIIKKLQAVGSEAQKSAYLATFFGKEAGPKLLQLVNEGAGGIAALEEKARSLGVVLSADTVKAAKDASDKLDALFTVMKAQGIAAVAALAPEIAELAQNITDGLPSLISWVERWADWFGIIESSPVKKLKRDIADLDDQIAGVDKGKESAFWNPLGLMSKNMDAGKAQLIAKRKALQQELEHAVGMSKTTRGNHPGPNDKIALKWGGGIFDPAPLKPASKSTAAATVAPRFTGPTAPADDLPDILQGGRKRIAQLNAEADAMGMSAAEAEAYMFKVGALNEILEKSGAITGTQLTAIDAMALAMQTAGQQVEDLHAREEILLAAKQSGWEAAVEQETAALARIDELRKRDVLSEAEAVESKKRIQQQAAQQRLSYASEFFGNLAALQSSSSRELAAIGKAAALTQATIDGVAAVQKALASAPPPWNFAIAASVGVATAANVARIAGLAKGGMVTGTGGPTSDSELRRLSPGEFVVNAMATRQHRSLLESINRGSATMPSLPSIGGAASRPINVSIRQQPGVAVEQVGATADEIEFIARRVVHKEGPAVAAMSLRNPNGEMAKAARDALTVKRRRS